MKKFFFLVLCVLANPLTSSENPMQRLTQLKGFSDDHHKSLVELKRLSVSFERQHPFEPSGVPIDIMIPIVEKDLDMLEHTVSFARRNVLHPIRNIYVVAPASPKIISCSERLGCYFVDESTVLPIQLCDISYFPQGYDRRGWLFQQFLKLSCDEICESDHILVIDADTLIVRPQTYLYKGYTIFNCADELHLPYRVMYERLMGEKVKGPFSFVCHCTLFEKSKLRHMKDHIRNIHNKEWFQAILDLIDQNETSGFAENETYPQFVVSHYPNEFIQLYFFNAGLNRKTSLFPFINGEIRLKDDYLIKSVSFHHYMSE